MYTHTWVLLRVWLQHYSIYLPSKAHTHLISCCKDTRHNSFSDVLTASDMELTMFCLVLTEREDIVKTLSGSAADMFLIEVYTIL